MIIVYLTCASDDEAEKIGDALLNAKLIACARRGPVTTANWWEGALEHTNETLMMMETLEEKFDAIEEVVLKMHSYETPALTAVQVLKTSRGIQSWLEESVN